MSTATSDDGDRKIWIVSIFCSGIPDRYAGRRRSVKAEAGYVEPLQIVFKTSGLSLDELLVALGLPWVVLIAVEIEKWLVRRGLIYQSA